eukprot:TRINITY_DN793_c2_g1_i1.p1 TRINITY_DN793_c2_g1~~TRINITY_DN793_c2_g1_i1.p1  ORF type:complete len:203 (-),score=-11.76 TRINITY_DN793_c2_g1_i1:33-641(-)
MQEFQQNGYIHFPIFIITIFSNQSCIYKPISPKSSRVFVREKQYKLSFFALQCNCNVIFVFKRYQDDFVMQKIQREIWKEQEWKEVRTIFYCNRKSSCKYNVVAQPIALFKGVKRVIEMGLLKIYLPFFRGLQVALQRGSNLGQFLTFLFQSIYIYLDMFHSLQFVVLQKYYWQQYVTTNCYNYNYMEYVSECFKLRDSVCN